MKTQSLHLASQPARHWFHRASLVLLLTVAATLMVMSKTGNPIVMKLRTSITDAVAPVLAVVASPMDVMSNAGAWVAETIYMRSDNIALKNQNVQLLQWQADG